MAGERFKYIREDSEGNHGIIHARNGSQPATLFKTNRAIVIGIGKPDAVAGKVALAVCRVGEQLTGFNF